MLDKETYTFNAYFDFPNQISVFHLLLLLCRLRKIETQKSRKEEKKIKGEECYNVIDVNHKMMII